MSYRIPLAILCGFLISIVFAPLVLYFSRKFKIKQTILHYVDNHSAKNGTPTMGGIIFIFGCILSSLVLFRSDYTLGIIAVFVMLSYGILGFLDDFIKIKFHQNEGLKPYQKIIGQLGIASIIATFCYLSPLVGTSINFFGLTFDLGIFYIPLIIFIFIAVTNSVNLIDGLDGLAGGVSLTYLFGFSLVIMFGATTNLTAEMENLIVTVFTMCGALIAFLTYNCHPAKLFMGDTGSLALGAFIAVIGIFSKNPFLIPIIGIMFVVTALSDIIQVFHYKRTKKRIFLMAPLHHHFERKGVNENRIAVVYIVITAMIACLCVLITLIVR